MSKIKKVFLDTDYSTELEVFCTVGNTIIVKIDNTITDLDVSTAIAFSKELRSQINLAKEDGER